MPDQVLSEFQVIPVKLFARARDIAGQTRVNVSLPSGATVADVRWELQAQFPALSTLGPQLLAAVNSSYAPENLAIPVGAEVAFFPPVSGG